MAEKLEVAKRKIIGGRTYTLDSVVIYPRAEAVRTSLEKRRYKVHLHPLVATMYEKVAVYKRR